MIINVEHRGPSYLVALDKKTGSVRWKVERASSSSWSSPITAPAPDGLQVIVSSAGTVDGYGVDRGDRRWSIGGLDGNSVPSPTSNSSGCWWELAFPNSAPMAKHPNRIFASILGNTTGPSQTPSITWRASKAVSDYASPVVCERCVYFLNKIGVL